MGNGQNDKDHNVDKNSPPVRMPEKTLSALDEKVKSMMEKGQKMIPIGAKLANGRLKHETSFICKMCGKEGRGNAIRDHIEYNHLEGVSIPCDHCGKTFSARHSLDRHTRLHHK